MEEFCTRMTKTAGNFRQPNSCNSWVACWSCGQSYICATPYDCPAGQMWDDRYNGCNYSWDVAKCDTCHCQEEAGGKTTTQKPTTQKPTTQTLPPVTTSGTKPPTTSGTRPTRTTRRGIIFLHQFFFTPTFYTNFFTLIFYTHFLHQFFYTHFYTKFSQNI